MNYLSFSPSCLFSRSRDNPVDEASSFVRSSCPSCPAAVDRGHPCRRNPPFIIPWPLSASGLAPPPVNFSFPPCSHRKDPGHVRPLSSALLITVIHHHSLFLLVLLIHGRILLLCCWLVRAFRLSYPDSLNIEPTLEFTLARGALSR